MSQIPTQNFNSFFGGLFGKKKPEADKPAEKKLEEKKPEKAAAVPEPTKYHKETVKAVKDEGEEDIKDKIRKFDRSGPNNLFGKY